jgi:hypothetical protein
MLVPGDKSLAEVNGFDFELFLLHLQIVSEEKLVHTPHIHRAA